MSQAPPAAAAPVSGALQQALSLLPQLHGEELAALVAAAQAQLHREAATSNLTRRIEAALHRPPLEPDSAECSYSLQRGSPLHVLLRSLRVLAAKDDLQLSGQRSVEFVLCSAAAFCPASVAETTRLLLRWGRIKEVTVTGDRQTTDTLSVMLTAGASAAVRTISEGEEARAPELHMKRKMHHHYQSRAAPLPPFSTNPVGVHLLTSEVWLERQPDGDFSERTKHLELHGGALARWLQEQGVNAEAGEGECSPLPIPVRTFIFLLCESAWPTCVDQYGGAEELQQLLGVEE